MEPDGVTTTRTNPGLGSREVPDWQTAPPSNATLTPIALDGRLSGSPATSNTNQANLYVLEIDVIDGHANDPLIEIGLPNTGASLTNDCSIAPRLHILALATRG